jgi:hypothetical protein
LVAKEDAVVRVQRFADKPLGDIRSMGLRSVDEIDAELRWAFEYSNRFGPVLPTAMLPDVFRGTTTRSPFCIVLLN